MANMDLLINALTFIEANLDEEMQTEDIAEACCVSKSLLEKAFKFSTHFSVHDYIIRRRMNKAARLMIEKPDLSLLDIAVQYGYSSHEAFTRAFAQVWKCTPTEYRASQQKKMRPMELFPQITGVMQLEGENFMRKTVDISELYDFLKSRKDCWFVCCDIQQMIPINNISRQAGDIAILEAMKRMEEASGEEDVIFRIGGDEFVLLTNSSDKAYADGICKKILALNGNLLPYKEAEVPLSLYAQPVLADMKHLKYKDLFEQLMVTYETKASQRK